MHLLKVLPETILDGDGIRYSIYLAGCRHNCLGCHNPESHSPCAGVPLTDAVLDEIICDIRSNPLLDGITLSGGDPMYAPDELLPILVRLKRETGLNLWCYTGYTYEALLEDPQREPLLHYIDVLVDGPFVKALYSPHLVWRGSANQRILHLVQGRVSTTR